MVPITVYTANRYLFVYTEISTNPKSKSLPKIDILPSLEWILKKLQILNPTRN